MPSQPQDAILDVLADTARLAEEAGMLKLFKHVTEIMVTIMCGATSTQPNATCGDIAAAIDRAIEDRWDGRGARS